MEKKVITQPQSEKAIMDKGFSAFDTYDDIKYWINYVKNNASLIPHSKTSECLSIISDILNKLNDKIKHIEDINGL